jgi:hypothetical protein
VEFHEEDIDQFVAIIATGKSALHDRLDVPLHVIHQCQHAILSSGNFEQAANIFLWRDRCQLSRWSYFQWSRPGRILAAGKRRARIAFVRQYSAHTKSEGAKQRHSGFH